MECAGATNRGVGRHRGWPMSANLEGGRVAGVFYCDGRRFVSITAGDCMTPLAERPAESGEGSATHGANPSRDTSPRNADQ